MKLLIILQLIRLQVLQMIDKTKEALERASEEIEKILLD
jgi:hypothetical protein